MKSRVIKFLIMLLTVIAVGSGATMLNLSMRGEQEPEAGLYLWQEDRYPMRMQEASETKEAEEELPEARSYDLAGLRDNQTVAETFAETGAETMEADAASVSQAVENEQVVIQEKGAPSDEEKQTYYLRLQDMEKAQLLQVETAMKGSLIEQQNAAEASLKAWDDELNAIYQKLRHSLPEEEFYQLRDEERAWIRHRDEAASLAAAKENYNNSTQKLAYIRSLWEWTRERVYELADMYYGH